MTDGFNTERPKRVSKRVLRETLEYFEGKLEHYEEEIRKGLKDKFSTLEAVKSKIETGDRKEMLEVLTLVADTLRAFDAPPKEARESLADCLETMRNTLEEAKGFSRKRGERSATWKRKQENLEFEAALAVEYCRGLGCSLENAIAIVAEDRGQSDSLVRKRWKRKHRDVKATLQLLDVNFLLGSKEKRNP